MNKNVISQIKPGDWVTFDSPEHKTFLQGKVVSNNTATILGKPVLSVEIDLTISSRNHSGQFYTVQHEVSTVQVKPKQIRNWIKKR